MYLDSVIPNTYGISKHPLFCLRKKNTIEKIRASQKVKAHDPKIFSRDDPIQVEGLVKKFGSFTAVKDLTFSIRQNEIFTVLGHNGAGKTTMIQMITGILRPTGGEAAIYGDLISENLDNVQ